ncbi:MAG: phospholipase [Proteobacteria bacterium]|nr:phospholipase [Pseudomonadota bacterium]
MKKILKPGRNCLGIFGASENGLLIDGRDYYKAFYEAARQARRYILITGWQFDSTVKLLRGDDAEGGGAVAFRDFLNELCAANRELEIYILAWDFSIIFSLEREWLQDWIFEWTTNDQIHFRFDSTHAVGASHHQKFVVIDGQIAFAGGMDICSDRWDDRKHLPDNPQRVNENGRAFGPYHDVQSFHRGEAAAKLAELFLERWERSAGEKIDLPSVTGNTPAINAQIRIDSERVALSRTLPRTHASSQDSVKEVKYLFEDAIGSAEKLIYIENQYFTSRSVYAALVNRMVAARGERIQVVIVLPKTPNAFSEEVSLGVVQTRLLRSLRNAASKTGHDLGIYYTGSIGKTGVEKPTYIHSKILLVDDRFLTVGSANTTNRSMGLDTELNVAWEADSPGQRKVIDSIRAARVELLAEHCGIESGEKREKLGVRERLVSFLDGLTEDPSFKLHRHPIENPYADSEFVQDLESASLSIIDPEEAVVEENVFELLSKGEKSLFSLGIVLLNKLFTPPGTL